VFSKQKVSSVNKVVVAAPTLTVTSTLTAPLWGQDAEVLQEDCGGGGDVPETAKDYFNQFKEIPTQKKHWICLKNYFY
jgi:hypothetical protein